MRRTRQNWWDAVTSIRGFDEDGEGKGAEGAGTEGGEGKEGEGKGKGGEGGGAEGEGTEVKYSETDVQGLKSALDKERGERKDLDKQLKVLLKAQKERDDKDKSEVDRLTETSTTQQAKIDKLATKYRENALNTAIIAAAGKAKFKDPTDALRPEILAAIGVEQDEDDPTDITVDAAAVDAAIKKLAKDKPHYLGAAEDKKLPPSGSKFGGQGQGNKDAEATSLGEKYPALARRLG